MPGWTARGMVEAASDSDNGLRALLRKVHGGERKENETHAIAACVIIAGTNDLAYYTSPDEITDAVLALHAVAHAEGVGVMLDEELRFEEIEVSHTVSLTNASHRRAHYFRRYS